MISPVKSNYRNEGWSKPYQFINFFDLPQHLKNMLALFLPIEDILKLKSIFKNSIQIHSLTWKPDQNQLLFRFTKDMTRVWTKAQLSQLCKQKHFDEICIYLSNIQLKLSELSRVITNVRSGFKASSVDYKPHDIDGTLDNKRGTFWSSDGSQYQNKIDWLLYDLGTVAVITGISIAAYKARHQINRPIYGFKKCYIELGFDSENFHYKTKEFNCLNTGKRQKFTTREHFENMLPAARYVKFWMKGCYSKQSSDALWYFAIGDFRVAAIPLKHFPYPVPAIVEVAGNNKTKTTEWFRINADYQRMVVNHLRDCHSLYFSSCIL